MACFFNYRIYIYSSTTSSTSIGHAFAQIPQAIHLEAGLPSVLTIRPKGQASAHLPQPAGLKKPGCFCCNRGKERLQ